jgi:hypothetical protein
MEKVDIKKERKDLYSPSAKEITFVNVPELNFIMIDGAGNPNNSQEYQEAIEALYSVSYTLKFIIKKNQSIDFVVGPLEGLWWNDDPNQFSLNNKDIWKWTAMIVQPESVKEELVQEAFKTVEKKKKLASLSKIRLERFREGLSVQTLFIGPYSEEVPTIKKIYEFIEKQGYKSAGKHHEIYLSNPKKTTPEKLKTIIRQPVTK